MLFFTSWGKDTNRESKMAASADDIRISNEGKENGEQVALIDKDLIDVNDDPLSKATEYLERNNIVDLFQVG